MSPSAHNPPHIQIIVAFIDSIHIGFLSSKGKNRNGEKSKITRETEKSNHFVLVLSTKRVSRYMRFPNGRYPFLCLPMCSVRFVTSLIWEWVSVVVVYMSMCPQFSIRPAAAFL